MIPHSGGIVGCSYRTCRRQPRCRNPTSPYINLIILGYSGLNNALVVLAVISLPTGQFKDSALCPIKHARGTPAHESRRLGGALNPAPSVAAWVSKKHACLSMQLWTWPYLTVPTASPMGYDFRTWPRVSINSAVVPAWQGDTVSAWPGSCVRKGDACEAFSNAFYD